MHVNAKPCHSCLVCGNSMYAHALAFSVGRMQDYSEGKLMVVGLTGPPIGWPSQ